VTTLIESTYANNSNSKVILLCHSMGSPMMLHFLQSKTDEWKDKYIRAMVTLAGVWGGTVRALKVYLLGKFSTQ
jgi:lysophospholipase-3